MEETKNLWHGLCTQQYLEDIPWQKVFSEFVAFKNTMHNQILKKKCGRNVMTKSYFLDRDQSSDRL